MTVSADSDILSACAERFSRAGLPAALEYLNSRTRFRFTGLYHVEPPLLRNLRLYDRENPTMNLSGEISRLEETYCVFPAATSQAFGTADAPRDDRLVAHAARDAVISYVGVPLRLDSGCVWGTLCHYDLRPRLLSSSEIEALETVAPFFLRCVSQAPD